MNYVHVIGSFLRSYRRIIMAAYLVGQGCLFAEQVSVLTKQEITELVTEYNESFNKYLQESNQSYDNMINHIKQEHNHPDVIYKKTSLLIQKKYMNSIVALRKAVKQKYEVVKNRFSLPIVSEFSDMTNEKATDIISNYYQYEIAKLQDRIAHVYLLKGTVCNLISNARLDMSDITSANKLVAHLMRKTAETLNSYINSLYEKIGALEKAQVIDLNHKPTLCGRAYVLQHKDVVMNKDGKINETLSVAYLLFPNQNKEVIAKDLNTIRGHLKPDNNRVAIHYKDFMTEVYKKVDMFPHLIRKHNEKLAKENGFIQTVCRKVKKFFGAKND